MIQTINNAMSKRRDAIENGENEKGFTLIELMVVIIIIGILAAIAIPVFLNQRQQAWDASAKSDLANMAIAAESYSVSHNGSYDAMTIDLLKSDQGLKVSADNTFTLVVNDKTSYTATAYNTQSTTTHMFTSTSGTIKGTGSDVD